MKNPKFKQPVKILKHDWHETSQSKTPMPTPTSPTQRPQQRRQLTRQLVTTRQSTGSWATATSLC